MAFVTKNLRSTVAGRQTGSSMVNRRSAVIAKANNPLGTNTKGKTITGAKDLPTAAKESERVGDVLDYLRTLPGQGPRNGPFQDVWDPANLSASTNIAEVRRWRESEITHGRVAMLASVGFLVQEQLEDNPMFFNWDGHIRGQAIHQFDDVQAGFWEPLLICIGLAESYRVSLGWAPPTGNGFGRLYDDYEMGNLYFDPLGLKPKDETELFDMQTKELNNGRLAMIAIAIFTIQELAQPGVQIFDRWFVDAGDELAKEANTLSREVNNLPSPSNLPTPSLPNAPKLPSPQDLPTPPNPFRGVSFPRFDDATPLQYNVKMLGLGDEVPRDVPIDAPPPSLQGPPNGLKGDGTDALSDLNLPNIKLPGFGEDGKPKLPSAQEMFTPPSKMTGVSFPQMNGSNSLLHNVKMLGLGDEVPRDVPIDAPPPSLQGPPNGLKGDGTDALSDLNLPNIKLPGFGEDGKPKLPSAQEMFTPPSKSTGVSFLQSDSTATMQPVRLNIPGIGEINQKLPTDAPTDMPAFPKNLPNVPKETDTPGALPDSGPGTLPGSFPEKKLPGNPLLPDSNPNQ